jgi:UDP-N-acetylglucosamine 2-epimerase
MNILLSEGLLAMAYHTGDIMVDTIKNSIEIALKKATIIQDLKLEDKEYNLLTLHRNYNVDNAEILEHLLGQLGQLDEKVVFPVHPRTRKMMPPTDCVPKNIEMIEPQGYFDFILLEYYSKRIITDSGGIQKEAYILRKPCVTLRTKRSGLKLFRRDEFIDQPSDNAIASRIADFATSDVQNGASGIM